MAPKRGTPSPSTPENNNLLSFPRANSPSSGGFTQFLTRPTKWFTRSSSNPKLNSTAAEPRASSSSARKHKISRPTDPRPILETYGATGARSVLDLSTRPPGSLDLSPSVPSSPTVASAKPAGLGDLRAISGRAWSKSADDLGKLSPTAEFSPGTNSFQEKVAQYRNRSTSNASAVTPPSFSNAEVVHLRQPFPRSRSSTSPSSSPPQPSHMPPTVTISPAFDENSPTKPAPHVHTRSHSFTPKLSSKLAAPRIMPTSPRKGSADFDGDKISPVSARSGLGFGFGSGSSPVQALPTPLLTPTNNRQTTVLLAPPSGSDDTAPSSSETDTNETKRASQIVYHTGFINRLPDVPLNITSANQPSLSKGWKPFKMELKGSKLYFYKPPHDRINAVKELFPTSVVFEEDDPDPDPFGANLPTDAPDDWDAIARARKASRDDGMSSSSTGRKKRAFWGRRAHPDLVRDSSSGRIEKGTFEALVHEAVFGTTFFGIEGDSDSVPSPSKGEEWKDFASSILLCLPSLVSPARFEAELLRCTDYLVSASLDEKKEDYVQRVTWLAGEYLRFHGTPVDVAAWDEWRGNVIPSFVPAVKEEGGLHTLPTSSSLQALYQPTPVTSPNINTFSPRPGETPAVMNVMDAFGGVSPVPHSLTPVPPSPSSRSDFRFLDVRGSPSKVMNNAPRAPWMNVLDMEGLSRDVLLLLDPQLVARSLTLFHREKLDFVPENLTAPYILSPSSSESTAGSEAFFGDEDRPHWLTKLLLMQILGADTSRYPIPASHSSALPSEDRHLHPLRAHTRSDVLSAWIKIGARCRLNGDECSWRAILYALCSPPIARLERVWKKVEPSLVAIASSWIQDGESNNGVGVKEPRITPWGGGIRALIRDELSKARTNSDAGVEGELIKVSSLEKTRRLFEGFRTNVSLCPRKAILSEGDETEEVKKLVGYWRDMFNEGGGSGALAVKFQRVDQFMSLSLAAEPRRKGIFEPYFWSRNPPSSHSSLLPILFPDPLPSITLIDRSQILRGRVDSDASDIQFLRDVHGHLRPDNQRISDHLDPIRDAIGAISRGGTVIPVFNGDLLLIVHSGGSDSAPSSRPPSSRVSSRPPSSVVDHNGSEKPNVGRSPSIRVKPGSSQTLDRKSSIARRSSLPTLSNPRNYLVSEPSSEPPLRVLVKAGTLNKLVDILVHGLGNVSVSVADDNGEMTLRKGMTRGLALDHREFCKVWWVVFRSFVTPLVFFELLRKKYVQAQVQGDEPASQYASVAGARSEVLEALKEWVSVGGGAQDIVDDIQLLRAMQSFMDSPTDHIIDGIAEIDDPSTQQAWSSLKEAKRSLRRVLQSCTMRPPPSLHGPLPRSMASATESRVRNLSTREPPDVDRVTAEELVDNLDGMACAAFSNVTEEDLFATCDLLEVQTADRTGWFSLKDAATSEDTVEIQTMYSQLQEVEPSPMISELAQDSLYRLLPAGIRSTIRAFCIMRKWIISKLVAPRIGLRPRQARMDLFLKAVEVARLRSTESNATSTPVVAEPCVRSFVEAVITSAILSTESRAHHRAWQNVAYNRGVACDSLTSLLSRPSVQSSPSKDALTVDMGWLLERLLDIISTPDLLEPLVQEGQSLIQFDKRRHLYSLITNTPSLLASRRLAQQNDLNRRAFERLNNIEREVFSLQFDPRSIKEEAHREGAQVAVGVAGSAKKVPRPFHRILAAQVEKNRRDRMLRLRLQKEKAQEQNKNDKRDDLLNRAMRPRKPVTAAQKQHRNKKSMSAFLNFMRPLSSAFTSDTMTAPGLRRTASELDFTPSGKPSLVLSMVDARLSQFINNERSFTFLLDTEDGGHYLLQSMSKKDMSKWMETISRVAKLATKRRLTYIGNSPKPQVSDHLYAFPVTPSRDPTAVFGVELDYLLKREAGGQEVPPGTVPSVIERCLSEIESRGLTEVGIYRIAGATSEINALKDAFNRGECPIQATTDIHAVCDLVKSWFRVLPESIFTSSSYDGVIAAMKLENLDARLAAVRAVVQDLPQANFDLLKRVTEHLDKVTDFEEQNQMTADSLAIVFSPNLLRAPQNDFGLILANMGHTHKLVKALITHFHVIFDDDPDPDADAEQEDELESPIVEEDEEDNNDIQPLTLTVTSEPLFPPDNTYTSSAS